jgi:hypothetical protein
MGDIASPLATTLFDSRMWSDGSGYVAGQFCAILKTETGGRSVK